MTLRTSLVLVQAASFIGLGALLVAKGETRLAIAQFLLAGVTWAVYV